MATTCENLQKWICIEKELDYCKKGKKDLLKTWKDDTIMRERFVIEFYKDGEAKRGINFEKTTTRN